MGRVGWLLRGDTLGAVAGIWRGGWPEAFRALVNVTERLVRRVIFFFGCYISNIVYYLM